MYLFILYTFNFGSVEMFELELRKKECSICDKESRRSHKKCDISHVYVYV